MSKWGRRQSYPAVVGTTLTLAAVFLATALIKPLIPDPEPNAVTAASGDYMQSASSQQIHWRTLEDNPFAEAKRADKPVFLLVGSTANWVARVFDRNVLTDIDVTERLNRDFVCVRVDTTTRPEWSHGPFPLALANVGQDPGWYILVARPDGDPLAWMTHNNSRQRLDTPALQSLLLEAQRLNAKAAGEAPSALSAQLEAEEQLLFQGPGSDGSGLDAYLTRVANVVKSKQALAENGMHFWRPWEARALLAGGLLTEARWLVTRELQSSRVDWLNTGFFRTDSAGTKFEKLAVVEAEVLAATCLVATSTGDKALLAVVRRFVPALTSRWLEPEDPPSYEFVESLDFGRAPGVSVRPSILAGSLDLGGRVGSKVGRFATSKLNLDPRVNMPMVPAVLDINDWFLTQTTYEDAFRQLRAKIKEYAPETAGRGLLGPRATVIARLHETARLLGDTELTARCHQAFSNLQVFRVGSSSVNGMSKPVRGAVAYLGSYVSFAEAALQDYLSTGDPESFQNCVSVFLRANELFVNKESGNVLSVPDERRLAEHTWVGFPAIVDGDSGSPVAAYMRVARVLALMVSDFKTRATIQETARLVEARYAPLARFLALRLGALAEALAMSRRGRAYVVVGGNGQADVLKLNASKPGEEVFLAAGDVRRDLQARGSGVWVCSEGKIEGPYLMADAMEPGFAP